MRSRTIPSLSALLALESAGRLGSFSQAAEELGVTQGAISRHIRALETDVGAPLFERSSFGVSLTRLGAGYLDRVGRCLLELGDATDAVRAHKDEHALRIAVPPTFAARWLVPRLARFMGMPVDLSVRATPLAAVDRSVDVEVVFGGGSGGTGLQRLTHSVLFAVRAPTLAGSGLIELGQHGDWAAFRSAYPDIGLQAGLPQAYDYFDAGIQAAILGRGLLLTPAFLVLNELQSAALVPAFSARVERDTGYFFRPHSRRRQGAVGAFLEWVRSELHRSEQEGRALLESPP